MLVRGQKEKNCFLREYTIIMSRMSMHMLIQKVEGAAVRSLEMRNGLSKTGGEAVLVIKQHRTWLNCAPVFVKVELQALKCACLASEIDKESTEDGFSPLNYARYNAGGHRRTQRDLLGQKEPELGFGKFSVYPY